MKKINTSPISGMQELLPGLQAEFNRLKAGIAGVFAAHGYQNIETPTIERSEVLLAKAGGDTEKQIYKVVKTAETAGDADQALRFDHTVPLARYAVEHLNDLTFPFKVSQIGRNFRGERAQKGRFREFYQCDVDVIGRNSLPIAYDADVIATLIDAIRLLPIPSFVVRVSNRKLLGGMLEELNLQHQATKIFEIIDRAEKVPPEATEEALRELGLGSENVVRITTFSRLRGRREEIVPKLEALGFTGETFRAGLGELCEVLEILERKVERVNAQREGGAERVSIQRENEDEQSDTVARSADAMSSAFASVQSGAARTADVTRAARAPHVAVEADMVIVRGLDYYTGTVFETVAPEYREIGSICSGGHYDDLASNYTDQRLPGVGGSIGLTRLFFILRNYGLIDAATAKLVDICLVPVSDYELAVAEDLADRLREAGRTVDVAVSGKKVGEKLKYAAKIADSAAVIGADEVETGRYMLKNLATGEMTELSL